MSPKLVRVAGPAMVRLALVTLAPGIVGAQTTGSVRGRVTESGTPGGIADAQVFIVGSSLGAVTNATGDYTIANVPAGARQVSVRRIGYQPRTSPATVGAGAIARVDFVLSRSTAQLDQIVVTALGQTAQVRTLGASQQTVAGPELAQTQRENFVNSLQGRVAGVTVNSTSGVPGASTSITIRGVSSISSSNQPLFIIDGLPMDNKTMNTAVLASDAPGSASAFNNRGVDFTNRGADIDPNDIETLTVLKGPEAAALYGIDASNGAIVITTKRGRAGTQQLQYSNSFRMSNVRGEPNVQRTYGPQSTLGTTTFLYFGAPYADTTKFYDNIGNFFQTGLQQTHNLSFSGGAADGRINYRVAGGAVRNEGVIPNTDYNRINVTGTSRGQVNRWLNADLAMLYSYTTNDQPFKGDNGPLIGLLVWPQTDDAEDYLSPAGTRRRLTNLSTAAELDNPFFNVTKNKVNSKNNRLIANFTLMATPFSWGSLKTQLGSDGYTNQNLILRSPESAYGNTYNGILDQADDITRNLTSQTILTVNARGIGRHLWINGLVGNTVSDFKSTTDALVGQSFLDPNFVSINNTSNRSSRTTLSQLRRVGLYGQATVDFNHYLYVNVSGRNDWTSTIPTPRNSFFYPGVNGSFVFTDAFTSLKRFMTGRVRAGYADAGRDAPPYAYRPSLEYKTTSYGSYGYGFTGPNLDLKPEFKKEYELGTELGFLKDRLGFDATVYRSQTKDQIVQNIRGSYATGFILFNLNGAVTRNQGVELTLRGTPAQTPRFSWDVLANFDKHHGETLALPNALPESYVSDTWLFGNVRNGTSPGLSTESLTGLFYLRNNQGKLLIDPTTGLPLRSPTNFIDAGYDRTPKYTVGVTNTLRYRAATLSFLVDFRRGGDIFNATEQFLTRVGLATSTLDRNTPRIIPGVLRDGKENSSSPTPNGIVVIPASQTSYYTNISEELFIERNINWVWLRDVTLRIALPRQIARNGSIFVTGTDLFLRTNYTGLDPMTNGNTASVGGSGAVGIDWGNFPTPRGLNLGLNLGF